MYELNEEEQKWLHGLERETFSGRYWPITVYKHRDTLACAIGDRKTHVLKAWMVGPEDNAGWSVILEQCSEDPELNWEQALVVGTDMDLTYSEAQQVAFIFTTEEETEFEFHRGIVLTGWAKPTGTSYASLSTLHDNRRMVTFHEEQGACFAEGHCVTWDPKSRLFRTTGAIRIPEENYYLGMDFLIRQAFDWLVDELIEEAELAAEAAEPASKVA